MLPAQALHSGPLDVCGLVLEVEQKPELETWIRNRDVYAIRLRLLLGLRDKRLLIDVEHRPNVLIPFVLIPKALRGLFSSGDSDADDDGRSLAPFHFSRRATRISHAFCSCLVTY
jgi:hypothetical protein